MPQCGLVVGLNVCSSDEGTDSDSHRAHIACPSVYTYDVHITPTAYLFFSVYFLVD